MYEHEWLAAQFDTYRDHLRGVAYRLLGSVPEADDAVQEVAALAADPDVIDRTGKILVAAALAAEYGFTDIDSKTPRPLTLSDV